MSRKITPVHYTVLIRIFELDGFTVRRKKGDHIVMTKAGVNRPLVMKTSPRMVPVTHIRTNMTTAGLSRERYFELLDRVT
jgi:predicted RNA binding protein YcfA (HicA-like mRNA interferase family)